MHRSTNRYLVFSGIVAAASGFLHLATIVGGPSWYRFIGAPEPIVRLAAKGHFYPVLVCIVAAAVFFACAAFAFSGAGMIRRLPFLRTALVLITTGLLVHGIAFIPLVMLRPDLVSSVYDGDGVNAILVVTSIICFGTGMTYALGTCQVWSVEKSIVTCPEKT